MKKKTTKTLVGRKGTKEFDAKELAQTREKVCDYVQCLAKDIQDVYDKFLSESLNTNDYQHRMMAVRRAAILFSMYQSLPRSESISLSCNFSETVRAK